MHRDVETGPGILNPVLHVFLHGFELPLLTSMSRMEAYQSYFDGGGSPLPVFALAAIIIAGIWTIRPAHAAVPQPTLARPAQF